MVAVEEGRALAKRRLRRTALLRLALSGVFVAGLVWALHRLDLATLAEALRHAAWGLVLVAAAVQLLLLTFARALRWRALLPPHPAARIGTLSAILLASQAMTNTLPLRPGEAYRTVALHRRGLGVDRVVASQVGEKVVDVLSLAVWAVPALFAPVSHGRGRVLVGAAVAAAFVLVAAIAVRLARKARSGFGARLARAVETLQSPAAWAESLAWGVLADGIDLGLIAVSARAVGLPLSLSECALVFLGVNLAIAIPAAPGHIGTLEAGAMAALAAVGAPSGPSLAFALAYHAVHVIPSTVAGALVLARDGLSPPPKVVPS
jgi:uncharacterized membrane protein YbhN (UPF0104 family)